IGTQFALNGVKARHAAITCRRGGHLSRPSAYRLSVTKKGIVLEAARTGDVTQDGLRAGIATLRQLFREFGRRLPCLEIRDHADFPRRGVMLDVSRGRVPKIETLLQLENRRDRE